MSIKELAYHQTELGELVLRRRPEPRLGGRDVFEVKLGEEFLMSSLFVEAEVELASFGLKGLEGDLDVVVGGLGLGHTAAAVLDHDNINGLLVVEKFKEVIGWHRDGLVPLGRQIAEDKRCEMVTGDFFELAANSFDSGEPGREFDAVLLDIDHSPLHHLDEQNAGFYTEKGLELLKTQVKPNGVFALWSNDPADEEFVDLLRNVFGESSGIDIEFRNPYTGGNSINSIYVARKK